MSTFAALSLLVSTVLGQAQAESYRKQLDAWADSFVGDWSNVTVVQRDMGPLKAGDSMDAYISTQWSPDKECFQMKYWAEVDGKVVNTTKGVTGWDASKKAIVLHWFNSWGGCGEISYKRAGEKWVAKWRATDPDGVVSTWTDTITCKPEGNHHHVTDRVIGGESKPDMDTVWKRR